MQVGFEDGAAGFHEARALLAIARGVVAEEFSAEHETAVLDALKTAGEVHLAREEFVALRAEQLSFEALAETARVGRERDAAFARILELERELHALRER
jgi:hypothetical protein